MFYIKSAIYVHDLLSIAIIYRIVSYHHLYSFDDNFS